MLKFYGDLGIVLKPKFFNKINVINGAYKN